MSIERVPDGIPAEDWATTPESVRMLVAVLLQTIEQVQRRIEQLEERLNQNSSNSSRPPSMVGYLTGRMGISQRDFQKLVDRQGESAQIGQDLLTKSQQLFILWHRVRDGTLDRSDLQVQVKPIQTKVHQYLEQGRAISHPQTSRTCQNLLSSDRRHLATKACGVRVGGMGAPVCEPGSGARC